MRTTAKVGMMVSLLWASGVNAADAYSIPYDYLDTGSNIQRAAVTWPVPVNKTYQELTPGEQRMVRDEYVRLDARDEPAYPRDGMAPILREVARIQMRGEHAGTLHIAVRVDERGEARGAAILRSPDDNAAQAVAFALMHTAYKPALCDGRPCASDYSFKYDMRPSHSVHVSLNRPMQLWTERLIR